MQDAEKAVEANRLAKMFGDEPVLTGIDLSVATGEAVAIVGPNGAGKTTLLRCLSSRLRPSSGAVSWFGRPASADHYGRSLIGVLGHGSSLYPHQTVRENLVFAARMCDVARPHSRVDELLEVSGLGRQAGCPTGRLSRGTRQRVAIMRALVHDPNILLLDEPSSGLDSDGTDWLVEWLKTRRARARAICFATHDAYLVDKLADRVIRLHSGTILNGTLARPASEGSKSLACASR